MLMQGLHESYESLNDAERVVLMIRFYLLGNFLGCGVLSTTQRDSVRPLEFDELAGNPR